MAENKVIIDGKDREKENDYILQVNHLTKLYGASNKAEAAKLMKEGKTKDEVFKETGVTVALWDVSFKVKRGEVFVIIGLSGSGKSTVVRMLNMLNKPTSGQVMYEDSEIDTFSKKDLNEYRRDKISMVFQSFGLMSHRDVLGNVVYGLEVKGVPRVERERKAMEMIEMVGLKGHEHTLIGNLSGGMRQRAAFLRTALCHADILLLDEPFGALDVITRGEMQDWLLSMRERLNRTVLLVTHDMDEAIYLSDRILILNGSPARITWETAISEKNRTRSWLYSQGALRQTIYEKIVENHREEIH